jgi:hypothetical protein
MDEYLVDLDQPELGIKRRGGRNEMEIKALVALADKPITVGAFRGAVQIWTKLTPHALVPANRLCAINKRRWLRKFDCNGETPIEICLGKDELPPTGGSLPVRGCNVEFTEISLAPGNSWHSFGLEAFGTLYTLEQDLRDAAAIISRRSPPQIKSAFAASYPSWFRSAGLQ